MISLSSTPAMLTALRTAKDITFSSYFLPPDGAVERELVDAARRGAHVTVRLNGYFFNGPKTALDFNKQAVRDLKKFDADAKLVHLRKTDGPLLHLKAAVCDGVAFLDDRNWARIDTIVRDNNTADVAAIRRAASYQSASCDRVRLDKQSALADEAALLRGASHAQADVAVESIGYSQVYSALKALAAAGQRPRLLVSKVELNGRYRHVAECLQRAGVAVRVTSSTEKFAVVAKRAWVGSANATSPHYDADQLEWGVRTKAHTIVQALQSRFDAYWRTARPLSGDAYTSRSKPLKVRER